MKPKSYRPQRRAMLENLEHRLLMTVITVTSTADHLAADGKVTLREAIIAANTDASVDGSAAGSGDDVIVFAKNVKGNINLLTVLPDLATNIEFQGPGATKLAIRRNVTENFRIFNITDAATISISGLTLTKGSVIEGGGAIHNNGTLSIDACILSFNKVLDDPNSIIDAGGGAIFNNGSLTISNSDFRDNTAAGDGGGIFNNGTVVIKDSIFQRNAASSGGAISNGAEDNYETPPISQPCDLTILNSTITANKQIGSSGSGAGVRNLGKLVMISSTVDHNISAAGFGGGGISQYNVVNNGGTTLINTTVSTNTTASFLGGGGIAHFAGPLTLINCTIAFNSSTDANSSGGGVCGSTNAATLINTIVAKNTAPNGRDYSGEIDAVTSFNNLIGVDAGVTGITNNDANKNKVGTLAAPIDPLLLPLNKNGSANKTHALKPKSPALNAGSDSKLPLDTFDLDGDGSTADLLPYDSRGEFFDRIRYGTVDIGAYEKN